MPISGLLTAQLLQTNSRGVHSDRQRGNARGSVRRDATQLAWRNKVSAQSVFAYGEVLSAYCND